jgi:hypothetical protein
LIDWLKELNRRVERGARCGPQFRFAPDIEIRVRGTQSADELARWERIADHLRQILMDGSKEEE